jgi:dihydrofolate reductase
VKLLETRKKHKLISIACIDLQENLGYQGQLLFTNKEDMKFFKETTQNHVVVMGKNTLLSLPGGKPLPNRTNLVLSADEVIFEEKVDNVQVYHDFEVLKNEINKILETQDVYIIGGASIYDLFKEDYDEIYLTVVDHVYELADVKFPKINYNYYNCIYKSETKTDPKTGYDFHFIKYAKKDTVSQTSSFLVGEVLMNDFDTIKQFINIMNSSVHDFHLISGRYVVNAKSIMGVMSLNLEEPLKLYCDNADYTDIKLLLRQEKILLYTEKENV